MAAKSGGDSKQGLIITLVIFILLTITLGVTTYLGFSGQTQLAADAKKAVDDKNLYDQDGDWYKFQALTYRSYMGLPLSAKEKESYDVLRGKFDQSGGLTTRDPEKAAVTTVIKDNDKVYGWDSGQKKVSSTAADKIADLTKSLQASKASNDQLKAAHQDEQTRANTLEKGLAKEKQDNKTALEKLRTEMNNELTKYRDEVVALQESLKKQGEVNAGLMASNEAGTKANKKDVASLTKTINELKAKLERCEKDAEQQRLVQAQSQAQWTRLETDKPRGEIAFINAQTPFINLGSADNVKPGLRFTVHGTDANGKANLTAKATLEVIEVVKPHMSQARVVKAVDQAGDPVIPGDKLFNPAWDPNRKTHVAISGVVDFSGNKRDGLKEFMTELSKQGIEVDAYQDLKDGEIKGEISRKTDFLILGDSLDDSNIRWTRDKDKLAAANKRQKEMQDAASRNGVKTVQLRDFLSATASPSLSTSETPNNLPSAGAPGGK